MRLFNTRRLIVGLVLLLVSGTTPSSQAPPAPAQPLSPVEAAARALTIGRFDEVDTILASSTDPRAIVLRAKAAIGRGRHAEAEKLLAGPAASTPGGDAALELGRLQMYLGRRQDGTRTLQRVLDGVNPRTAADFLRLGLAAQALGQFQAANGFLRDANRLSPDDAEVNTAWGELFLEKYNQADALKSFQAALKQNENHLPAKIGLARVAYQANPPAAREAIDSSLKLNASYTPAHLLSAEIALDDRRRADARASIKKVLDVNPNSLEARSLEAAIAFLEGRSADFEAEVNRVLRINPVYGEVYRVTGDHLGRNYRFDEAVEMSQRALKVDGENSRTYADLGMHLLRTGDEPAARRALERAFKDDPFDAVTFNSLSLLDTLDKFETVQDGDIIFRFHPDEVAVMREQALPLAKEALATLSKRYGFTPKGPILMEMFPKHDDFAVRTLGLPGFIGALGACFGRVVTLDSPRARPPGEFNWGVTLWHEIAHVITLQMSNNRMPRWLSEGMSQWEERRARPEWGREMEVPYAQALEEGRLLKLDKISEGFSDPKLISLTYYQASEVVEYLVDTYGEPALHNLLRAYGKGLETEDAIKEIYGVTLADLQTGFDAKMERDYAALRRALKKPELKATPSLDELKKLAEANPGSFPVQMELAQALHEAGDRPAAIQALERAAVLVPSATGDANPNALIARIATEQKDNARTIRALDAVLKVDHTAVEAARQLAALVAPLGDAAKTEDAYRRVVAIDPFDSQAQTGLGRLALARKDAATAVRAFRSALATNPPDRAAAHVDLAEAYLLTGQRADARRQTLAALEMAPSFERAQELLLKIMESGPN